MDPLYEQTLQNMERALHMLTGRLPPPKRVPMAGSFVFRYTEQTIHQAIVQKLGVVPPLVTPPSDFSKTVVIPPALHLVLAA
jgi:hypothetical protein